MTTYQEHKYEILVIYDSGLTEKIVCEDYSEFFTKTDKFFNDGYKVTRLYLPHSQIAMCVSKHANAWTMTSED